VTEGYQGLSIRVLTAPPAPQYPITEPSLLLVGVGSDLTEPFRLRGGSEAVSATDCVQMEPAGATAGKSFSGSNTLLKKFVREYMATSATISMTCASV